MFSPVRTLDYQYHVVVENVVEMTAKEWNLRLLLALLAGGIAGIAVTTTRLDNGTEPAIAWGIGLVVALVVTLGAGVRLVEALGTRALRFTYKNGVGRDFYLTRADTAAVKEAFGGTADTVSLSCDVDLARDSVQSYNLANLVTVEASEYEFSSRGAAVCLVLSIPVIALVAEFVPVVVPVGGTLLVGALAVVRYWRQRYAVVTPRDRRRIAATEAEEFFTELDESETSVFSTSGRSGGIFVKHDYRVAIVGENVVSLEKRIAFPLSELLVLMSMAATLGLAVLHWDVVSEPFGMLAPTVGEVGVAVVTGLALLVGLMLLAGFGLIHSEDNYRLRLERYSGSIHGVKVSKSDADAFLERFK